MTSTAARRLLLATTCLGSLLAANAARADDASAISAIERQILKLKSELAHVRTEATARDAEVARARATAEQAREEAREANRRANASEVAAQSGGQSFTGGQAGGFYQPVPANRSPGVFSAENLPNNDIGAHRAQTGGEQQASALGRMGRFQLGGVSVQLGGFIEALAIERTRNETSDFASTFAGVPYPNTAQYHEPEFRGSARQSRFSMLIEGKPSTVVRVAGYYEMDFGSSGISSNSNESNSYSLRVRQVYATFDRADWGLHVLAGQAWSMLTMDRIGITPRQENIPLVADGQIHVGFNWARQWQARFVKDFDDHRIWAGLSFEEPQTVYSVANANSTGVIGGTVNYANAGGSLLNSTANYSDDIAPDVIAKLAFDPSFGHYEIYGVARFMNTRETLSAPRINTGENRTALAGGGGAGMLLPIIGPKLVFQASGLVGQGIGRYGSGQLPDATINQNGTPVPIPEAEALIGLVAHPIKTVDLFAYVGTEQEAKRSFNEQSGKTLLSFGYGNGYYADSGCFTEGSTVCSGQTRGLVEGTVGGYWRFMRGDWGTLQFGPSWSYVRRTAFEGTGATRGSVVTPKTDDNIILFSFRYLPFL